MSLKSFKMLEFQKIISMLKKNAITSMGIEMCENLLPENEINKVKKIQRETTEAVSMALRIGMPPIIPVSDFTPIAQKIKIGGVLIPKELLNTATILKSMRELKDYYRDTEYTDLEILNLYFENLYSNLNVEKETFKTFSTILIPITSSLEILNILEYQNIDNKKSWELAKKR